MFLNKSLIFVWAIRPVLIILNDLLTIVHEKLSFFLECLEPSDFSKYDIEKIVWTKETDYEKAIEQDCKDFRVLVNVLEDHNGKIRIGNYFFWILPTENAIMRRPIGNNRG